MLFKKFHNKKKIALLSNTSVYLTYEDLENEYDNIKKVISKYSLILIISENSIGMVANYTSLIKNECIIQFVEANTEIFEIKKIIELYKPNYILCSKKWLNNNSLKNLKLKKIYSFLENNIFKTDFINKKKINNHLSILLPTSGSLGSKKYAKISKKNIYENTKSIISYLNITKMDRSITSMPICYSYMLSVINTHLEVGGSIFVTDETLIQGSFWKIFKNHNINNFNGVPFHYEILIKLGLKKKIFKNLKFFTQAGGKLDINKIKKILEFCRKEKKIFYIMYGQTEASPRMSYIKVNSHPNKLGSIGKPIPNGHFILIDNNGKKIKNENKIGELVYTGKNVFMGYAYDKNDLFKKDKKKKILKTGDLAYFDKEGFYFISGRKNRIIKIYGNRYGLDDIEEKFLQKKIEIACKNDEGNLAIFVKIKSDKNTILKNIYKIIPLSKNNLKIKIIKEFPRHNNGKIDYKKLI